MRGFPLVRAVIAFLVLLSLAPLLWQVTHSTAPASAPVEAKPTEALKIALELAFTTTPKRVEISHLGKPVWVKEAPESREELELDVPWPKQGVELKFEVEWAADLPLSAMRAKLTDPHLREYVRSMWGRGKATDVLGFP